MASLVAPLLFTEARINIEPSYQNSILHIPTAPPVSTSLFSGRKRIKYEESDVDQDEEAYAKRHLATEGSVFFRRNSPRSFLWRVLDDRKLLEIQCVDILIPKTSHAESGLTFALSFAHPIRPNGIAFADPEERDALDIFVLTTANELFTVSLKKDMLLRGAVPSPSDFDPSTLFKCYKPTSFSFRHPYKLVAANSLELLVSLHDGGVMLLDRKPGDNGSTWRETFFSEGGWSSSFKGLIPWKGHNTAKFGDIDLEPSSAAALALSPDDNHLFTVSLDHTLKAWNKQTGKTGVSTDLLGENDREHQSGSQYLINPAQTSVMHVVEVDGRPDGDLYYLVTNSPKDHQFKFWAVRDADSVEHGLRDVQPDAKLIPPLDDLMNTNVWQLVEFHVKPGYGWTGTQLWIRVRAGAVCRIFTLTFDLLASPKDLEDAWQYNWAAVDEGSLAVDSLLTSLDYPADLDAPIDSDDPTDPSERWLDFLLCPGRFSTASLESALYVYKKGLKLLGKPSSLSQKEEPLKERLCGAIAAKINGQQTSKALTYDDYRSEYAIQWQTYFGLVKLLHGRRGDSLSVAFDPETFLPWSVRADFVSPVRACDQLETFHLNSDIFTTQDDEYIFNSIPIAYELSQEEEVLAARLIAGARAFRRGLSPDFHAAFDAASTAKALARSISQTPNGLSDKLSQDVMDLYENSALHSEVSDEDFNRLTDSMQCLGGLGQIDNRIFLAAIDVLAAAHFGKDGEQQLTRFGDRLTIRVSQETLHLTYQTILDLLALLVFMAGDLEPEELSEDFDAAELYDLLIVKLKEHKVLLWLSSNVRQEPVSRRHRHTTGTSSPSKEQPVMTVFESILIGDWQGWRDPKQKMPYHLTQMSRSWAYGANLPALYNNTVPNIMGDLIKYKNYDLAFEFARFLPDSPWVTYLRARLHLALGDYALAGELFKRASQPLADITTKIDKVDGAALLSPTQRPFFADGIPRYFLHIASLYEAIKIHTFAADFAKVALDEMASDPANLIDDETLMNLDSRKRGIHGSPAAAQVDLAMEEIRLLRVRELKEEILSRVFNAALQTGRWRMAFDALMVFGNPVLRDSSLHTLLNSLILTSSLQTLLSLPWPPALLPQVDASLLALARKHLAFSPIPTPGAPQYHQVVYAFRIQTGDFRGAALVLWERLQRLKTVAGEARASVFEPDGEVLVEAYLVLLNALAVLGEDEGWILVDEGAEGAGGVASASARVKRRVVTVEDVRKEYVAELDRRSEMSMGRFAFDAMDVL